jgi:hypothetical protein
MRNSARAFVIACVLVGLPIAACDSSSTSHPDQTEAGLPGDAKATSDGPKSDTLSPPGDAAKTPDGSLPDSPASPMDTGPGIADAPLGGADVPLGAIDSSPGLDGTVDRIPISPVDSQLSCGQAGAACQSAGDCCGLACVAGRCSASACISDGKSCTSGGECCSTICGTDKLCKPLNTQCKTAGNACTANGECCNGTCNANHQCAAPAEVSFCAQKGDLCRADRECCTGVCQLADGGAVGTCAAITTSCKIDGTLCDGCGDCCSHFCGPFGASGPKICQPASGCHVQGDLCHKDSDCCGGDPRSALPGAGLIKCEPDPVYGARIGTCGNPTASNCPNGAAFCKNACNPEGNVCHFKQTLVCAGSLTNVRNDCCDCVSGKECCQPDATGIPRCNSLAACVPTGGNCSFSGECCNHEPCLPDPTTGQLKCGSACVAVGGTCTTNGDCCAGMLCQSTPGSLGGICVIPTTPPPVKPDGGLNPDSSTKPDDAAAPTEDAPPACGFWGQSCSSSSPCCGYIQCSNVAGDPCTGQDTACTCFNPV